MREKEWRERERETAKRSEYKWSHRSSNKWGQMGKKILIKGFRKWGPKITKKTKRE